MSVKRRLAENAADDAIRRDSVITRLRYAGKRLHHLVSKQSRSEDTVAGNGEWLPHPRYAATESADSTDTVTERNFESL